MVRRSEESREKLLSELTWPATSEHVAMVLGSYSNPELGPLSLTSEEGKLMMRSTAISSEVATKTNEDGSISLVTVSPGFWGADILIGERDSKRVLILNDNQHEYVWEKQ